MNERTRKERTSKEREMANLILGKDEEDQNSERNTKNVQRKNHESKRNLEKAS
jgi:uncharacterized membrane protein